MNGIVNLVSGGLDSTLVGVLNRELGINQFPLFIDYGQRAREREWLVCQIVHKELLLPPPLRMDLSGFGAVIQSGLTNPSKNITDDAFTPGRNFIFLLVAASYAYQVGAASVSIGLLAEKFSLFPDQRSDFLASAEQSISLALGRKIQVVAPLSDFSKAEVVAIARSKGISGTYSCHAGGEIPCGVCISCKEFLS